MAEWKKVAVSGSNISQFNNDAGYITSATNLNAYATASINGVELLAGSPTSSFSIVTGSVGTGLTISGSVSNDTITFDLANIPNTTLANSTVTIGTTAISLGGTATTVNGLTITNGVFSGSFSGSAILPNLTNGLGVAPFTYNGSTTATVTVSGSADLTNNTIIKWNDTDGKLANSSITDTGTLVTVTTDALFQGNLTVEGTASFQETQNLLVADRFALFASGSIAAGDGGIVVQQGTQNVGELFGYENTVNRWGFTSSFNATSGSFTPSVYVGAVQVGTGQTAASAAPIYGGATNGYGTIHVDTDDGEIWIYA